MRTEVPRILWLIVALCHGSRVCRPTENPLSARQTDVVLRLAELVPRRVQLCTGDADALTGRALRTVVYGRVLNTDCRAVADASVSLLQRDSTGEFRASSHCSGSTSSDRDGRFAFATVLPGKSLSDDSFSFRMVFASAGRTLVTGFTTANVSPPEVNGVGGGGGGIGVLRLDVVLPPLAANRSRRSRPRSNGDWLNRRLVPYADWDAPASLAWQRKRGWGSQDIAWLKRRRRKRSLHVPAAYGAPPSANGTVNRLAHNRIQKWLSMLKAEAHKKKWNSDSGMSWIKRRDSGNPTWQNIQQKKWNDAGVAWIKRAGIEKKWAKDSGMSWIKRDNREKKWARDSGMAWIKRDNPEKKWARDSGMAWIKRDNLEKKWAKDSGMAWIKRDNREKKWARDSGMAWIKRDNREKKWAKDSGMSWIKRGNLEKKWAKDSGMSWIKRGNLEKKWAKDSGMSWIKREHPEKKWAKDSGMSWIKRETAIKKWAKDSGMSWIKKSSTDEHINKQSTYTVEP